MTVDFKKDFIKQGKSFVGSDNIFVFYERDKILKRDILLKFLIKNAKSQEFNLLEGLNLKSWLEKEFKSRGARIERDALEKFISFIDNDSWQIINELEKLVHYRNGEIIKTTDISLLMRSKVEPNIFECRFRDITVPKDFKEKDRYESQLRMEKEVLGLV